MHLFYIDDSKDEKLCVFSAIAIPGDQWNKAFQSIKSFRKTLKDSDGILMRTEFHATEFVGGRGRLGPNTVSKYRRCELFRQTLSLVANLPGTSIINVCFNRKKEGVAFERLLNRINMAMVKASSYAVVISDRGKEQEYTKLARRMGVFNPIPSRFGTWDSGSSTKNIPVERILDDLVFKDSRSSYFIQLADFCAYALLRRENPLPSKGKYGIDKAFDLLQPVLNRNASYKDPEGIVRT